MVSSKAAFLKMRKIIDHPQTIHLLYENFLNECESFVFGSKFELQQDSVT